jgi:hypothetical protein
LSERASGMTSTARSSDRVVEVTIDSSGGVTRLQLSERIRSRPAHKASDEILAVMRAARAQLAKQIAEAADEVGAGDVGRTVAASYADRSAPPAGADDVR